MTTFDRTIKQVKNDVNSVERMTIKQLQSVAREAANKVYSQLCEKLQAEGNQEALTLLHKYNDLDFFYYEPKMCEPADIATVKKAAREIWGDQQS